MSMNNNYNKNSTLQMDVVENNLKSNEIFDVVINKHKQNNDKSSSSPPIKILDIGCSHGMNSISFLKQFISMIRNEWSINEKTIEIFHSDLPVNDFSKLFIEIYENNSYSNKSNNIYSYGIGNSFENQLVPNNSIDLIFSFNSLHWVTIPINCKPDKGLFISRDNFPINFIQDRLSSIFIHRYNELKVGGIFTCNFNIALDKTKDPNKKSSRDQTVKLITVFNELIEQGKMNKDDIDDIIIPSVLYTKEDYDYSIEKAINETGGNLKLINKSRVEFDFSKTLSNNAERYVGSILGISGTFIKRSIKGDESRKQLIFNHIRERYIHNYNLNPTDFQFYGSSLFLTFEKVN